MKMLMRSRLLLTITVGLWMGACTGCRLLVDGVAAWRGPLDDERWEVSAKPLREDLWRQNNTWSPLHELSEVPISDPGVSLARWMHPKLHAALIAAEGEGFIAPAVRRELEAGTNGRPGGASDAGLNRWFRGVVGRNDVTGWNAAILWSHYDAAAAYEVASVLERLVLHPPYYKSISLPADERDPPGWKDPNAESLGALRQKPNRPPPPAVAEISHNMRQAAAEAWCLVLGASPGDPESAFAPAGRALQDGKLPSKVADELWRGIARRVRPDRIPGLAEAFDGGDADSPKFAEARRAAAEACVIHAVARRTRGEVPPARTAVAPNSGGDDPEALSAGVEADAPWPKGFWNCRHDPDPKLRRLFGEFVAVSRHPAAFLVLKAQLNDIDLHVRESVYLHLGVLGTEEAFRELAAQSKRAEERVRELTVQGLACQGPSALAPFTTDKSVKVRADVARSLRRRSDPAAARVMRDLLTDSSLEVQLAGVQSICGWPEDIAAPLLMESLAGSMFKTRQIALRQLEELRGGGLPFPLYAGPQERALRVQQWTRDWNIPDATVERVHELTRQGSPLLDEARLADFREKLQSAGAPDANDAFAQISVWAAELTPADLPLLERLLDDADPQQSDLLLHHLLPRLSSDYGALAQLENADVAVRREGASRLGKKGQEASLTPGICRRLGELMKTEQDSLVWRLVMLGVHRDGSEEVSRLALLAINHHWPDVRILGCEYVGRHEVSEQAVWLLPLFYDTNKAVQLSAVTAAGKCRNPIVLDGLPPSASQAGLRGLRPLLTETRGQLQFAVVASMSRLGDQQAMQELTRQAMDDNSTARLDVVQTMGETGQTRFVEPLIRLAWTEPNPHVRQAALGNLKKLVPPAEQPPGLPNAKSVPEAVEIWVGWWEDRKRQRSRL